jgi:hypothetical protein
MAMSAVLLAVWFAWRWIDPEHKGAAPPAYRAHYDAQTKLWVTFPPAGKLAMSPDPADGDAPRLFVLRPIGRYFDRAMWALKLGSDRPEHLFAGRLKGGSVDGGVIGLRDRIVADAKQLWPDSELVAAGEKTDIGLGGRRVIFVIRRTDSADLPRVLYVALLGRDDEGFVAWADIAMGHPVRSDVRAVMESLLFREPPK